MTLAARGGPRRRRRGLSRAGWKWGLAIVALGLSSLYAYLVGTRLAQIEIDRLQSQIATLSARLAERDRLSASHARTLESVRANADRWQRAYQRDVPRGEDRALFEAMTEKLSDGVSRRRLAFVIAGASNQRDCDDALPAKRFIVTTPLQRIGPNNAVSFHGGAVVVTAAGISALDGEGNAEAWFDPAKPVSVRIVALSGEEHEETGLLPLHPSLVAGGVEHRLSVLAGPVRGFVQSSLQTCRYP